METEKEIALSPCRCGSPAKIEEFFVGDLPEPWYVATCAVCPIKTYDQTSAEEAARIWNTSGSVASAPAPLQPETESSSTITTADTTRALEAQGIRLAAAPAPDVSKLAREAATKACSAAWDNVHWNELGEVWIDRPKTIAAIATALTPYLSSPRAQGDSNKDRPKVICLCGSTRFVRTWVDEYQRLSDEGNIVLTVARMPPRPNLQRDEPELKIRLDQLHKQKIALADEVYVLDVDGYIGDSTRSEIAHAAALGKPIRYLSQEQPGYQPQSDSEDVEAAEREHIKGIILSRKNLYALCRDETSDTIRILCDQLLEAIEPRGKRRINE